MTWFLRYQFVYPSTGASPEQCLAETLQKSEWRGLKHSISDDHVKIERKFGIARKFVVGYTSWSPIFVGRFVSDETQRYLKGHFRVNWYTLLFSTFFLGMLVYMLAAAIQQPEVRVGYIVGWRTNEIEFFMSFIAIFLGITFAGWLMGLPCERRILAAIRESTATQLGAPADVARG